MSSYAPEDIALLAAYILVALVFSFLCSIAEAVLLSITPSFIERTREKAPKRAALLARLRQSNIDQSLAAILTLNTIAHTVGAVGAGAQATKVFGNAWIGVFSAVMTLLILFLSEIIPKTIGAVHWRSLSRPTALFVQALIRLLYPLIWIAERLTRLIAHGKNMHVFSRDEFIAMADVGERSGRIDEHESRIFRNLFQLGSLRAMDIMTPRIVIFALQQDLPVAEAAEMVAGKPFSRYPIFAADIDDVPGFVLKEDILTGAMKDGGETRLRDICRELRAVPESTTLPMLLEFLLEQRQPIALVVDEYGGTAGLVTLEDVVETLLGMEIVDEMDTATDMRALARRQWEKRAQRLGVEVAPVDAGRDGYT
ncbi:MAG: hemolysin family protein [Xanthomonadales bacterium]|nr:hemolysin family protein [Xanthomonadales bacterium]